MPWVSSTPPWTGKRARCCPPAPWRRRGVAAAAGDVFYAVPDGELVNPNFLWYEEVDLGFDAANPLRSDVEQFQSSVR